jgi:HEAT repeat protein
MPEGVKQTIPQAGEDLDQEISSLIAKLNDPSRPKRREARRKLFALGQPAMPAIIATLLNGPDNSRWQIAKAISELHDPAVGPALVKALKDDSFGVRWLAAEGLIHLGRDSWVPLLEELIVNSDSVWLREGAHHVLHTLHDSGLEPEADAVVEGVLVALEGGEPTFTVPGAAGTALGQLKKIQK